MRYFVRLFFVSKFGVFPQINFTQNIPFINIIKWQGNLFFQQTMTSFAYTNTHLSSVYAYMRFHLYELTYLFMLIIF